MAFWDQFTLGLQPVQPIGLPPTQQITRPPLVAITDPYMNPPMTAISDPAPRPPLTLPPGTPVPMPGPAPVQHLGYGTGGPTGMYNTPFVRDYVSPLLPEAEFRTQLGRMGLNENTTRRGQYAQSRFGDVQKAYQMRQLHDPALSFRDFLKKEGGAGNIMKDWRGLTAAQRGLSPQSRSSVIRWG